MIREHVTLLFDPLKSEEKIQKCFRDDVSRTLWLGIKQGHIVHQDFEVMVLRATKEIKKHIRRRTLDAKMLRSILTSGCPLHLVGWGEMPFVEEFLIYVLGGKRIEYTVEAEREED